MNQERKLESCVRFRCRGSIANSAKSRIDKIIAVAQKDAEAMIEEGEAPDAPILPPPPSQALVEVSEPLPRHVPRAHSQSSKKVDPNREYKIRRAALGGNPSKEEMDAVVAYGLAQHRKNFPHLYSEY